MLDNGPGVAIGRQIQEQKRALKKLPWKRKSLVLAVFVLLRGRFRERFRRNGKRDLHNMLDNGPGVAIG